MERDRLQNLGAKVGLTVQHRVRGSSYYSFLRSATSVKFEDVPNPYAASNATSLKTRYEFTISGLEPTTRYEFRFSTSLDNHRTSSDWPK